jgi:uncharacterized iron-regulated protein
MARLKMNDTSRTSSDRRFTTRYGRKSARMTQGGQSSLRGGRGLKLAFQREMLSFHRAIFRSNQERINRAVVGYGASFRRYERDYLRSVRHFERPAQFADLDRDLMRAQVLYVGDYHTLPQAQRAFLRLLRSIDAARHVTVALEFVPGRFQAALDAFLDKHLSVDAFLRAIHHDEYAGFGSWSAFAPIFQICMDRGYRIIGIDGTTHGARVDSLQRRDQYAARRIAENLARRPEDLIAVLMGELHLAPNHLPAAVTQARGAAVPQVIVYQNCHELYWQLESRGLEQEVEFLRVRRGVYCLVNTPPIVCQQSFLNWIEADDGLVAEEAPEQNFKRYARMIAAFFDLPLGDELDDVELTSVIDLSFLSRLRRRGDFSTDDLQKIHTQILRSESYFIPRARMVYLGNLSVNHAAEEATHFLRYCCSHSDDPKYLVDAFYARVLEEALGFLGAKVINHKRKCPQIRELERLKNDRWASGEERALARLVLRHVRMEEGKTVRGISAVYSCGADLFNAVTHVIGYRLGERLYYALVQGLIDKRTVRTLFFDRFDDEGEALATYLQLILSTRQVRIPERF